MPFADERTGTRTANALVLALALAIDVAGPAAALANLPVTSTTGRAPGGRRQACGAARNLRSFRFAHVDHA